MFFTCCSSIICGNICVLCIVDVCIQRHLTHDCRIFFHLHRLKNNSCLVSSKKRLYPQFTLTTTDTPSFPGHAKIYAIHSSSSLAIGSTLHELSQPEDARGRATRTARSCIPSWEQKTISLCGCASLIQLPTFINARVCAVIYITLSHKRTERE